MCKYNKFHIISTYFRVIFHIISTNFGVIFHIISIILGLIFHIYGFLSSKRGAVDSAPTGIM